MRVLNVCVRIDRKSGGGSVAVVELAKVFVAAGFTVDNWVVEDPSDGDLLSMEGLQSEFFKTSLGSSYFRYSIEFTKAIRTRLKNYDVVILSGLYLYPNSLASYYCRQDGIPYIYFPYDSFNPLRLRDKWLKKFIYRILIDNALVRGAALIQAANDVEREQVVNFTGRTDNVFVASYGFKIEEFSKKIPGVLFNKLVPWNVENTKTILYLARISRTKGIETLIDAYEKLIINDESFRLLIVGPPWDKEYFDYLIEKFGDLILNKKIHFSGIISDDEKYSCFQNSYLYVLPSYAENFGITVLEAISNSLVPIVTDSVPWPELVDCDAGYRVATRDVDAILGAILQYSKLPAQAQNIMRDNALNLSYRFDYASIKEIYSKALRKAASLRVVRS